MNEQKRSQFAWPATILSLGIIISAIVGSYTFFTVRSFDNTLSVTGSAKEKVTADSVKWNFSITKKATEWNIQQKYGELATDLTAVKKFLSGNGIKDEAITISPVMNDEIYKYDSSNSGGPKEYNLRQQITVQSAEVQKISEMSKNTNELVSKGVYISTYYPEFFYSKLADLRVKLLADAVKDAKARAEGLAVASGRKVGSLKSASSGVVQVLAPNSVEISDYGQYDTTSIDKEVMITVRAIFLVK